ncbi:DUF190 domain-containing protein [Limnobacter litoralis]|uniref:DUF190 domain-containing protein n=1 Tax=Limnobacter litoralis TaxID=481366 RepID=A0ABQ5YWB4_9BURK|nr:DUF190 domain-containing protein [Limnobacter litoralis]GLR27049.1 hypothetical protein GCM10007875_21400 [Limnobacter litoralis]
MHGYQLTFFTEQNRKHGHVPMGEWLIQQAKKMGLGGATLSTASEGFGHAHKLHAARFFELADQPLEVTMAVTQAEAERVFELLRTEKIKLFYVKTPIEFGTTDEL